jgi:pimeloyl-ACP methyl ester carboxylesterase
MSPGDIDGLVQQFWTVAKAPHDDAAKAFLARGESHTVEAGGASYEYFRVGTGPTVLCVHGVHSNLASMVGIAEQLLEHGYEVVLFDAPAHGEAPGTTTNPIEVRGLIRAVVADVGELDAIVTHSLGGLWTLASWSEDWTAKAFVSISSPATLWFLLEKFAQFNSLGGDQVEELGRALESSVGGRLWADFSPVEIVKTLDVPGLIIHGTKDELVPADHAAQLHEGWRGSTVELVDGAGHYDIAAAPRVREMVPAYLEKAIVGVG